MKLGLALSVQHRPGDAQDARFREHVDQVRLARAVGFDSIWAGQHYLAAPFTYFQPMAGSSSGEHRRYKGPVDGTAVPSLSTPDAGGDGEIVLTTVHRRVMPLVRYRTGDVARWIDGACPCGLPFRRLSALRGRLDETVACVWGNVDPAFFEDVLAPVGTVGPDWQVALHERHGKPVFQFAWKSRATPRRARTP